MKFNCLPINIEASISFVIEDSKSNKDSRLSKSEHKRTKYWSKRRQGPKRYDRDYYDDYFEDTCLDEDADDYVGDDYFGEEDQSFFEDAQDFVTENPMLMMGTGALALGGFAAHKVEFFTV